MVTGPAFQGRQVQSLHNRVLVPTATWKAIYDPEARGAAAYSCTNISAPKCTTVSIAVLIRETGIDPFPAVPAAIKQTAMTLPPPEPSRYTRSAQKRGQHDQHWYNLFAR